MRRGLARLLRVKANEIEQLAMGGGGQMIALRAQCEQIVLEVRRLAKSILYEMDAQREEDLRLSEQIKAAIGNAGNLYLHRSAHGVRGRSGCVHLVRFSPFDTYFVGTGVACTRKTAAPDANLQNDVTDFPFFLSRALLVTGITSEDFIFGCTLNESKSPYDDTRLQTLGRYRPTLFSGGHGRLGCAFYGR
jgi:hypothetical protein